MKTKFLVKLYLITLGVFLLIDMIWLGVVAQTFYQSQIGYLLTKNPNVTAAGIFYLIYIAGLLYFVVLPALKSKKISMRHVAGAGAFFGLVAYATYELTNYATITDWPFLLVIVDLLWGAVLSACTAAASFFIAKKYL